MCEVKKLFGETKRHLAICKKEACALRGLDYKFPFFTPA